MSEMAKLYKEHTNWLNKLNVEFNDFLEEESLRSEDSENIVEEGTKKWVKEKKKPPLLARQKGRKK
jgi:hypothetical protein